MPDALQPFAGKREFKEAFDARTDADVAREHTRLEATFAREMREAGAKHRRSTGNAPRVGLSPRGVEHAHRHAADLFTGVHGLDEDDARDLLAEVTAARYPSDPEDGLPVGLSAFDALTVRALRIPDAPSPAPTLEDARAIYVKERLRGGTPAEDVKAVQRVDRMMREAKAALGRFPALVDLTREDARKVRDHMLGLTNKSGEGLSPASVKRNLTTMKAIVNFAAVELGLPGTLVNPFNKLDVAGMEARFSEGQLRDPLPPAVLQAVRERVTTVGNLELALIWRLLQGTGCRIAEVTGLRAEDVTISGPHPCVKVAWHEGRRVKTQASIRHVHLVGDALEAAKGALERLCCASLVGFPFQAERASGWA